jgi:hypothetical protein
MTYLEQPRIARRTLRQEVMRICDAAFFGFLITVPLVGYSQDPFTLAISASLGLLALVGASGLLEERGPEKYPAHGSCEVDRASSAR